MVTRRVSEGLFAILTVSCLVPRSRFGFPVLSVCLLSLAHASGFLSCPSLAFWVALSLLGLKFFDDAGAVAVSWSVDAKSLQHGQPHIAQWCVLGQDKMLAKLQVGSATGQHRRAIGQVMDGADVRSKGHGGMVEEARSIRFLGRFEFVDQAGQEFAVGLVTHLRGLHPFAGRVMAHIVGTRFEIETLQQGLAGQSIGQYSRAVCLQCGDDEILHDLDLGLPLQTGLGFLEGSSRFGHLEPGFVFVETRFDVTDSLKVFVEFFGVIFGQATLYAFTLREDGIQNTTVFGDGGLALCQWHVIG